MPAGPHQAFGFRPPCFPAFSSPKPGQPAPSGSGPSAPHSALPPCARAQASTEYLIVLAVVLTLALIILGAFGLFPSFSYGAQAGDSARWWASAASPLQIADFKQTGSSLSIILVNSAPLTVRVGGINLSTRPSAIYTPSTSLPVSLPSGGRTQVDFTTESCAGRQTLAYEVSISYTAGQVGGLSELGAKPLYVQCSD